MTAAATPEKSAASSSSQPEAQQIDWGLLAEPEMQSLIRNQICNSVPGKINAMYNWLGHVLDGHHQNVLPSKGVEMKRISMIVCGSFLDRVVPFLNSKCHTDCVVEAYYLSAPPENQKADEKMWKLEGRMWVPEKVEETPRQRAGTIDILLNREGGGGGGEDEKRKKWKRRFSLYNNEPLGLVHIRIGLEMKIKSSYRR